MTMIKIKISLVNIFANSKLEMPFNCMMVISFDVYSLLREIMIPKKTLGILLMVNTGPFLNQQFD